MEITELLFLCVLSLSKESMAEPFMTPLVGNAEVGFRYQGPEPTQYGDWHHKGVLAVSSPQLPLASRRELRHGWQLDLILECLS
eukprot:1230478-Amphidinium_carterae.1